MQPSGSWVPGLYFGTDGQLRGLFWNGGEGTITSSGTVNDGKWHYAVLAASPTGQSLYLDGTLVGSSFYRSCHVARQLCLHRCRRVLR